MFYIHQSPSTAEHKSFAYVGILNKKKLTRYLFGLRYIYSIANNLWKYIFMYLILVQN